MHVWLSKLYRFVKSKCGDKKEIQNVEYKANIRPSLNELKLLNAISELKRMGMLELVIDSSTLYKYSKRNNNIIDWQVYRRFLEEEIDEIGQLKGKHIQKLYKIISIPNIVPTLRMLYEQFGRHTPNMIQARDEKTKDEINKIILTLQEYNLRKFDNMQHGVA